MPPRRRARFHRTTWSHRMSRRPQRMATAACCRSGCSGPWWRSTAREAPGTVIIDTGNTYLYYVLGQGRAIRYGVGVGREGFTWAGVQTVTRKAEWPDWHPPAQMIARQPYLPRFMAGGPGNPLGARAMYLGSSEYRIHGTNDPTTIGKFVSSGCIRLTNEDVSDLFSRVEVGARVVVLPKNGPHIAARAIGPAGLQARHHRSSNGVGQRLDRPSGDEPFDVVTILAESVAETADVVEINQAGSAVRGGCVVRAGAGAGRASRKRFPLRAVRRVRRRPLPPTRSSAFPMATRVSPPIRKTFLRRVRRRASASSPMAAARLIACAPATAAISRFRAPTGKAGRRRATASARRAIPKWCTAAISTAPPRRAASPIPNCRTRSVIATRSWRDAPATERTSSAWAGQARGQRDAPQR